MLWPGKKIADLHRRCFAENNMDGRHPPADISIVDNIIMDERGGMNEFRSGCNLDHRI